MTPRTAVCVLLCVRVVAVEEPGVPLGKGGRDAVGRVGVARKAKAVVERWGDGWRERWRREMTHRIIQP